MGETGQVSSLNLPESSQKKQSISPVGHFSPRTLARLLHDLRVTNKWVDFGTSLNIHPELTDDLSQDGISRKDDILLADDTKHQLSSTSQGQTHCGVYEVQLQSNKQDAGSSLTNTSADSCPGIPAKIPDKQRRNRAAILKNHRIGRLLATEAFIDNQMIDHVPKGIFSGICKSERHNTSSNCYCHNSRSEVHSDSENKAVSNIYKFDIHIAGQRKCYGGTLSTSPGVCKQNGHVDKNIAKNGNLTRHKIRSNSCLLCNRHATEKQDVCESDIPNTATNVEESFSERLSLNCLTGMTVDIQKAQRSASICSRILIRQSGARVLLKRKAPPLTSIVSHELTPPKRRRLS